MPRLVVTLAALAAGISVSTSVHAQVAFVPNVGAFPNGVTLGATPVVSADRRYVRMSVNPQFNALEGFDTVSVPAAVSGGGVGGFRSVPAPGTTVSAGMDGLRGPEASGGSGQAYGENPAATDLLSGGAGFSAGPTNRGAAAGMRTVPPTRRPMRTRGKPKRSRGASGPRQTGRSIPAP